MAFVKNIQFRRKSLAFRTIYDGIGIREWFDKVMQAYANKALKEFIVINFAREIKGG